MDKGLCLNMNNTILTYFSMIILQEKCQLTIKLQCDKMSRVEFPDLKISLEMIKVANLWNL